MAGDLPDDRERGRHPRLKRSRRGKIRMGRGVVGGRLYAPDAGSVDLR
jgi:hypothetical protein